MAQQQQSLRKLEAADFVNHCRKEMIGFSRTAFENIIIHPNRSYYNYETWTYPCLTNAEKFFNNLKKPDSYEDLSESIQEKVKQKMMDIIRNDNKTINPPDPDLEDFVDFCPDETSDTIEKMYDIESLIEGKLEKIEFKKLVNTKEKEEITDLIFEMKKLSDSVYCNISDTIKEQEPDLYIALDKAVTHYFDKKDKIYPEELEKIIEEEKGPTKFEMIIGVVFLLGILWLAWKVIMFFYHLFT